MDSTSWWVLLLDLDHTLIQTDVLHRSLWREILASYGVEVTEEVYSKRIAGRSDVAIWEEWKVGTPGERARWNTWRETAFMERIQETVPTPGGRELVDEWIRAGQWVGIITHSNKTTAEALLRRLEIHDIDVWITSESGVSRPSPAPYRTALKELDISPERCVVVEGSEAGLQSARQIVPFRLFRVASCGGHMKSIPVVRDLTDPRLAPPAVWRPSWLAPTNHISLEQIGCDS